MTRRSRPLAALLAVFALVFAQLAVSAHACKPREYPARSEVTAHHAACHEMAPADQAPATDNLCLEHCQYGDASVDNVPPIPAAIDSGGPVLRLDQAAPPQADLRPASRLPPAAAPPPPAICSASFASDLPVRHPARGVRGRPSPTDAPTVVVPNQAVVVNNTNYTVTYLNGSPVLLTTNEPTPYGSYFVNPTNYGVRFCFTNGPATFRNDDRYSKLSGRLTGNIKPGKKSTVNGGKPLKVDEAAMLFTESLAWAVVEATNFVQQTVGGSLVVNLL